MYSSKQHSSNKLDNLGERDKFLERHKLPKLTQKELENLNGFISGKKIESVIKTPSTKKSSGRHDFPGISYQTFKEELIPINHKIFQKKIWETHSLIL